jgi:thiol-disulfide isomerase/thioredoxin
MDAALGTTHHQEATKSQDRIAARLNRAATLRHTETPGEAIKELETALAEARATPYEIEFQTRVRLAMSLTELYLDAEEIEKASAMLVEESAFTEKISEIMRATGTPPQARAALAGHSQVRDRAIQIGLLGHPAPEISVTQWVNRDPVTLHDLRGSVVLLEFWATWCKPCDEMFPKLKELYEGNRPRGLEIVALTRHYYAQSDSFESKQEELQLIRSVVERHKPNFYVGVAEDEKLQRLYGATGLPTLFLIDRQGIVRSAGPGQEEARFKETLRRCLDASDQEF